MNLTKRQLQAEIDKAIKGNNMAIEAQAKIDAHYQEVYGGTAGDFDCDAVIDAVEGGAGKSVSMSFEEFDRAMRESAKS